jgi:hypothetical protein
MPPGQDAPAGGASTGWAEAGGRSERSEPHWLSRAMRGSVGDVRVSSGRGEEMSGFGADGTHQAEDLAGATRMRVATLSLLVVPWLVIGVAPSDRIAAQQEGLREDEPRWRAECAAAVAHLEGGVSESTETTRLLHTLSNCERSAGSALAAFWLSRPSDEGVIRVLSYTSQRMHDRRIMDAVVVVVEDPSFSGELRMAALEVLASYVDPRISLIVEYPDRERGTERYGVFRSHHKGHRIGTMPLGDQHEAIARSVISRLAARGVTDERLSGAAEEVLRLLSVPDSGER